jgi:cation transport regulator ChaB
MANDRRPSRRDPCLDDLERMLIHINSLRFHRSQTAPTVHPSVRVVEDWIKVGRPEVKMLSADRSMPYDTPESLPAAVRADLPPQEQRLYFDAFKSAWQRYADFADREAFCHRLARSAVRRHQSLFVGGAA